jgi:hypothetical protein
MVSQDHRSVLDSHAQAWSVNGGNVPTHVVSELGETRSNREKPNELQEAGETTRTPGKLQEAGILFHLLWTIFGILFHFIWTVFLHVTHEFI